MGVVLCVLFLHFISIQADKVVFCFFLKILHRSFMIGGNAPQN